MLDPDYEKQRLIREVQGQMERTTGKRYQVELESLPLESLRELLRFARDLEAEKNRAVRQATHEPWRRW